MEEEDLLGELIEDIEDLQDDIRNSPVIKETRGGEDSVDPAGTLEIDNEFEENEDEAVEEISRGLAMEPVSSCSRKILKEDSDVDFQEDFEEDISEGEASKGHQESNESKQGKLKGESTGNSGKSRGSGKMSGSGKNSGSGKEGVENSEAEEGGDQEESEADENDGLELHFESEEPTKIQKEKPKGKMEEPDDLPSTNEMNESHSRIGPAFGNTMRSGKLRLSAKEDNGGLILPRFDLGSNSSLSTKPFKVPRALPPVPSGSSFEEKSTKNETKIEKNHQKKEMQDQFNDLVKEKTSPKAKGLWNGSLAKEQLGKKGNPIEEEKTWGPLFKKAKLFLIKQGNQKKAQFGIKEILEQNEMILQKEKEIDGILEEMVQKKKESLAKKKEEKGPEEKLKILAAKEHSNSLLLKALKRENALLERRISKHSGPDYFLNLQKTIGDLFKEIERRKQDITSLNIKNISKGKMLQSFDNPEKFGGGPLKKIYENSQDLSILKEKLLIAKEKHENVLFLLKESEKQLKKEETKRERALEEGKEAGMDLADLMNPLNEKFEILLKEREEMKSKTMKMEEWSQNKKTVIRYELTKLKEEKKATIEAILKKEEEIQKNMDEIKEIKGKMTEEEAEFVRKNEKITVERGMNLKKILEEVENKKEEGEDAKEHEIYSSPKPILKRKGKSKEKKHETSKEVPEKETSKEISKEITKEVKEKENMEENQKNRKKLRLKEEKMEEKEENSGESGKPKEKSEERVDGSQTQPGIPMVKNGGLQSGGLQLSFSSIKKGKMRLTPELPEETLNQPAHVQDTRNSEKGETVGGTQSLLKEEAIQAKSDQPDPIKNQKKAPFDMPKPFELSSYAQEAFAPFEEKSKKLSLPFQAPLWNSSTKTDQTPTMSIKKSLNTEEGNSILKPRRRRLEDANSLDLPDFLKGPSEAHSKQEHEESAQETSNGLNAPTSNQMRDNPLLLEPKTNKTPPENLSPFSFGSQFPTKEHIQAPKTHEQDSIISNEPKTIQDIKVHQPKKLIKQVEDPFEEAPRPFGQINKPINSSIFSLNEPKSQNIPFLIDKDQKTKEIPNIFGKEEEEDEFFSEKPKKPNGNGTNSKENEEKNKKALDLELLLGENPTGKEEKGENRIVFAGFSLDSQDGNSLNRQNEGRNGKRVLKMKPEEPKKEKEQVFLCFSLV